MLGELACTCERCDRSLGSDERMLTMRTDAGARRAYECSCGAVTITVVDERRAER